jgi:two-component system sensor histidine kinase AdeS
MARLRDRIVTRLLLLAGLTALITVGVGLGAYYVSTYYQLYDVSHRMPPKVRAELRALVAANQRGSDRYFELYDRYGGAPDLGDIGFISMIALVSSVTGGCVAVVLARRISRPIAEVAQAAVRVSAGNRSVRVERRGASGEISDLIDSFNHMAAEIEFYERERTILTAGIAHELRTPLTILKGRLHGLADGVIDPATGEANRLLRQVEQLSRLVEDLRTLAHADAGELDLDLRRVDVDELLRAVVADLRPSAEDNGVRLVECYEAARALCDPVRVTQVVTNLLTNAIKHAPPGSPVTVSTTLKGGFVVVGVLDEGEGFAADEADRLFMPFWRGENDKLLGRPGSGVGLALAAKLAEAHGGKITAKSRTDRSGASFHAWLPVAGPRTNRRDMVGGVPEPR